MKVDEDELITDTVVTAVQCATQFASEVKYCLKEILFVCHTLQPVTVSL